MLNRVFPLLVFLLAAIPPASAVTYQVGPGRAHTQLATVATIVNAGDVIELDAGSVYNWVRFTRPGTAAQPITLRGTAGGAQRPIIDATSSAGTGLQLDTDHYVIEDVVVRNAATRCIYLHGHNLTLRRVVAHTCATHGILGSDNDSGDMLLTEVEVYGQGNQGAPSTFHHPIYIATDHELYPNAVLRIEKSWVHDNYSGNSIKSRARNVKIFHNWLETTHGQNHTVEAIGPDGQSCPVPNGSNAAILCNGEIVGNVLLARGNNANMMRLGGDGTGNSYGRYHVVNNTFIANSVFNAPAAMIRAFGNIDSIELHNNIFWIQNGDSGAFRIIRDIEAVWASGARKVTGKNNLITGSVANYNANPSYIAGLTNTIFAATTAPIFVNIDLANPANLDLRLRIDSVARAAGHAGSTTSPGYEIPNPTNLPAMQPPRMRPTPGQFVATARPQPTDNNGQPLPNVVGLGAYEYAVAAPTLADFDFNGDGRPDLIWSNTGSGATYIWRMNGVNLISDSLLSTIDPIWKVQGVGDFNGDGHHDVVWRHTGTGNTYVWYLVNGVFQSDAFLFSLPPEWVIQGVADFNADDRPDFLMRNVNSGNAFAWFFNNNVAVGDQFLFNIDPSWKVEGVSDLNADGQPDLLFRNVNSGLAFAWNTQFSAGTLSLTTASSSIFSIDSAWEVVQIADWNNDNKPDLLFRNKNSGVVFVWYMDGTTLTTSDFIIQIDPVWEIVPRR